MGNCGGRKKKETAAVEPEPPSKKDPVKREELSRVLNADKIPRKDGDAWFVVEAAWVHSWLTYVNGDQTARRPGPIQNESLLVYSDEDQKWRPKPLLRGARREHMGHYRRVNAKVWELWCGDYKGSGPPIWVNKEPFEDTANWQLDPNFDPTATGGVSSGANAGMQGGQQPGGVPGQGRVTSDDPARLWPSASQTLAIGEMEDDRVGDEAKAQAAAFFDCVLGYPPQSLDAIDDGRGQPGEGVSAGQGMGAVGDTRAGSRAGSDKQHSGARAATGSGARLGSGAEGLPAVGEGLEGQARAWFVGDGSE